MQEILVFSANLSVFCAFHASALKAVWVGLQ
jgi:hypothetical protein